MNRFWKRLTALVLLVCMLTTAAAAVEPPYPPYPEELQIAIIYEEWTHANGQTAEVGVPVTCRDDVNAVLRQAQQEVWEEAALHAGAGEKVEMMATFRVSGESWAGFLLTGRVVHEIQEAYSNDYFETVYLTHRMFSFDLKTGQQLVLKDVFPPESEAWTAIAQEAQKQLTSYYPDAARDESIIGQWCSRVNLENQPFLPCAGRLLLKAPLWPAMPEHWQLIDVNLYYPTYRPLMTETAFVQTDNSHRPIVALTYDDGPSMFYTPQIRRHLATYGASATFFVISKRILGLADGVRGAMDEGHSVGSHTYKHNYEYQMVISAIREDRQKCLDTHRELLGVEPFLFRAPGGHCEKYVQSEIGWPIILWSYSAGDTGNNTAEQLASRIINGSQDGDILLMHDIKQKTAIGTETFLREMTQMGFMFATVEELLYLRGYTIEPNLVYHSAYTPVMTEGLR